MPHKKLAYDQGAQKALQDAGLLGTEKVAFRAIVDDLWKEAAVGHSVPTATSLAVLLGAGVHGINKAEQRERQRLRLLLQPRGLHDRTKRNIVMVKDLMDNLRSGNSVRVSMRHQ